MAVVASLKLIDLPPRNASFPGERLEERPGWIFVCHTAYEYSRNTGLAILAKVYRLLETAQTEITQACANKISRLSGFQSPEIQLTLPSR